jgi:threonine/homoserine/homoserine lactone efflux protein
MLRSLLAFAAFAAVLTITPGLDTVLVLRTTARSGGRAGFAAAAGICLGCLCWAAASALGLTALLTASALGYQVLRWAGVGYLCYLGARTLWTAGRGDRRAAGRQNRQAAGRKGACASTVDIQAKVGRSAGGALRTGLTTNLLNPKVGAFYLSVLPQFLPDGVAPLIGATALSAVHVIEGLVWLSAIVFAAGRAARWLARPVVRRRLDQLTGLVFLGFGVQLALHRTSR